MSSKVVPYDIHVPPPQNNNFLEKGLRIIEQLKIMIFLQASLGINRLFLLKYGTTQMRLSYLYSSFLFLLAVYFLIMSDTKEQTFVVFKETTILEYLMLIFISSFMYKETLRRVFCDLTSFDEMLNISNEPEAKIQVKRGLFFILISVIYCAVESVLFYVFLDFAFVSSTLMVYITFLAHDSEQTFFVTLITAIMLRVRILKAHIAKSFNTDKDADLNEEIDSKEFLANNVHLDTTAMHRAYELLHKCAEQLNSAMSFPMIVMLFTSGLSTTLLLKKFFQISQANNREDRIFNALLIYVTVRCTKYTLQVIIPCYYASITSRQVLNIRTMLHNAVNTYKLEKVERRKIKAFFHLAQDNEFTYALWGVIRLSMSLPLSYASLCTTYLVITIQFSKFID